ncbi:MAG: dolichyl-phosphate-mannose--protein mannosyltransferase [Desulfovibrionaceae bacterium]
MEQQEKGRAGLCERIYAVLAAQPLAFLAILLALQTWFLLEPRALWFSDEIRYANVFEHLLHAKKWLVLHLNGEPYPDKPPVYFWLLGALYAGLREVGPRLFFLGAAVSGFLFLAATLGLNRMVAGGDKRDSLAAGLVLLSTFYFTGVCHYSRMDLLFGALITCSHICLYRAWTRHPDGGGGRWTNLGFFLAALATLTKGPLGLAFPLFASVAFLAWTGRLRRFFRKDVAGGLALAVGVLALWVLGAWLAEGNEFMRNIFHDQIYKRATDTWHHGHPFHHYLLTLPAALAPWPLALLALPVWKLATGELWARAWQARKAANPGPTYLWIMFLTGFALLSAISIKIIIYLIPLFAPAAVLLGRAVVRLDGAHARRLGFILAGLLGLAAAALPLAHMAYYFSPESMAAMLPWHTVFVEGVASDPVPVAGLIACAGVLAVAALSLWKIAKRGTATGVLLLAALAVTAWLQPLGLLTAPSLDAAMSPRAQGEMMRVYADQGYLATAFKVYPGTYTYYAGRTVLEMKEYEDMDRVLAKYGKVVVGMRQSYWDEWPHRPADMHVVHVQWIVDRPFVLAVRDGAPIPLPGDPAVDGAAVNDAAEPGKAGNEGVAPADAPAGAMVNPDAVPSGDAPETAPDTAPAPTGGEALDKTPEQAPGQTPGQTPEGATDGATDGATVQPEGNAPESVPGGDAPAPAAAGSGV